MDRLGLVPLVGALLLVPVAAYIYGRPAPLVVGLALVNVVIVVGSLLWMTRRDSSPGTRG